MTEEQTERPASISSGVQLALMERDIGELKRDVKHLKDNALTEKDIKGLQGDMQEIKNERRALQATISKATVAIICALASAVTVAAVYINTMAK